MEILQVTNSYINVSLLKTKPFVNTSICFAIQNVIPQLSAIIKIIRMISINGGEYGVVCVGFAHTNDTIPYYIEVYLSFLSIQRQRGEI
jgi:hypothetical protein